MPLVYLNPDKTLVFNLESLTSTTISTLTIQNVSDDLVGFKIKTTAPKSYLVRPSSGVLAPNAVQDVQIILQPLQQQVDPRASSADRFLVQTCIAPKAIQLTKETWQSLAKSSIEEQRLTVDIKMPPTSTATGTGNQTTSGIEGLQATYDVDRFAAMPRDSSEVRQKYEDLQGYAASLEKAKKNLEAEVEVLRKVSTTSATQSRVKPGFELWQVILIVLASLAIMKLVRLI